MSNVPHNSHNYEFATDDRKKTRCKFCKKEWSSGTLNVNSKAAHLSDKECAKKYQITLCSQVPIEIAVLNASYINSIREKSSIKNVRVQIIEDRTETGRQEVEVFICI